MSHQAQKQLTLETNKTVNKYIREASRTSKNTAREYLKRLSNFQSFVSQKYDLTLDELITTLTVRGRGPRIDIYDLFSEYISFILQLITSHLLHLNLESQQFETF